MDKSREEFETKFGVVGTRMPNGNYSSWAHQAKWDAFQAAWQHQQAKVDLLKGQLIKLGFTDNGGLLMKPPLGKPSGFALLDERPICKKRARKLRKRAGVSVYWSKHLECLVWGRNKCHQ